MRRIPLALSVLLLVVQVALIGYARTTRARYFCWAPFDMQTDYTLLVVLDGQPLTAQQVRARYRRPATGTDNRSVQNLIDIIEGVEQRAARRAQVTMRYRINGNQEQVWRFPAP